MKRDCGRTREFAVRLNMERNIEPVTSRSQRKEEDENDVLLAVNRSENDVLLVLSYHIGRSGDESP